MLLDAYVLGRDVLLAFTTISWWINTPLDCFDTRMHEHMQYYPCEHKALKSLQLLAYIVCHWDGQVNGPHCVCVKLEWALFCVLQVLYAPCATESRITVHTIAAICCESLCELSMRGTITSLSEQLLQHLLRVHSDIRADTQSSSSHQSQSCITTSAQIRMMLCFLT